MKNWLMPAIQTVFVSLLVLSFYATSWFGEQYVLRAEPFDPFDPFYGEFVMLQYPDLDPPAGIPDGAVYFTLTEAGDGYAVIDRIEERPFFGAIKGTKYDNRVDAPQLERYYVEQGLGPELEDAVDLEVTIDVSPWGSIRPIDIAPRDE